MPKNLDMMLLMLSISPVYLLLSYVVAEFAGAKRKIGRWWTFFFCLTFTPVIGLIFVLFSEDRTTVVTISPFGQTLAYVLSYCSLIFGVIILAAGFNALTNGIPYFIVAAGFIGGNFYGIWKILYTPTRDD
jgi:hypothetical protein